MIGRPSKYANVIGGRANIPRVCASVKRASYDERVVHEGECTTPIDAAANAANADVGGTHNLWGADGGGGGTRDGYGAVNYDGYQYLYAYEAGAVRPSIR